MKNKILKIGLLATLLLSLGLVAHAYEIDSSYRPQNLPFNLDYDARSAENNTIIILQIIAGGLLYFAAPVAVIMIAFAGWSMIVGGAETDKVDQAKKNLTWAIVGLIVIIMSYSIVRAVLTFAIKAAEEPEIGPAPISEEDWDELSNDLDNENVSELESEFDNLEFDLEEMDDMGDPSDFDDSNWEE